MATFKSIAKHPPIYESDHAVAIRSTKWYLKFYEHKDGCARCKNNTGTFEHGGMKLCWRGADIYRDAQKTMEPRVIG